MGEAVAGMYHVGIIASDYEQAVWFYHNMLGLKAIRKRERPENYRCTAGRAMS